MNPWKLAGVVLLAFAPVVSAWHDTGCVPESADPSTYMIIDLPFDDHDPDPIGERLYQEERDSYTSGSSTPGAPWGDWLQVPFSGFASGHRPTAWGTAQGGSWTFEETWAIPGLQRYDSIGLLGDYFPPGCDSDWSPQDPIDPHKPKDWLPSGSGPCTLIGQDSIGDETCGHGPDSLWLGMTSAVH